LVCSYYFFMSRIRLGTLNLNGARDSKKRAMLYDTLASGLLNKKKSLKGHFLHKIITYVKLPV